MNDATNTRAGWRGSGRLETLNAELQRQLDSQINVVIDSSQLDPIQNGSEFALRGAPGTHATEFLPPEGAPLNPHAFSQLCQSVSPHVPVKFGRELLNELPMTGAAMFRSLLRDHPKRRLVRLLDGRIRAVLSDSYRMIDNYDIMTAAIGTAMDPDVQARPLSASLTDNHMRLTLVAPQLWRALDTPANAGHQFFSPGQLADPAWRSRHGISGDEFAQYGPDDGGNAVWPGIRITNSETGSGATVVQLITIDRACFNMCVATTVQREIHLGSKLDPGILRSETIQADGKAKIMVIQDAIRSCFKQSEPGKPSAFDKWMNQREGAAAEIVHRPTLAVDNVVSACDLTQDQRDNLLEKYLGRYSSGGRHNRDGLSQSLASMAQEAATPDDAANLELAAGKVISHGRAMVGSAALNA